MKTVLSALRRLILLGMLGVVGAGAASALWASPAFAGYVDHNSGYLYGSLYNATPYTMTEVAQGSPEPPYWRYNPGPNNWDHNQPIAWFAGEPATTIAPGQSTSYVLAPSELNFSLFGPGAGGEAGYDGWVTYRVDVLGGAPEYITFSTYNYGRWGTFGDSNIVQNNWNTTAPPPANYDGAHDFYPPGPVSAPLQVFNVQNRPSQYDQFFLLTGNYKVDASTSLGAPFVGVLNAMCAGAANTSCSFTQTGPLTWGIGTAVKKADAEDCTITGAAKRGTSPPGTGGGEPPPTLDPNWSTLEYEEAQSATLSVGGGVALSTEFNLFDTISGKISVKVEAEHEWQETNSLTKTTLVYIPSNNIGSVWVAPTVGKVTGTLVLSSGSATFTVTNFSETRSGVTVKDLTPNPKDDLTPASAFSVITRVRPMTASEYAHYCRAQSSTGLGSTKSLVVQGRPPVRLVAGRGVARVGLGQTQAQVLRGLGAPSVRLFTYDICRGLDPGCGAVPARGGIWMYRQLSVMFGIDRRVSGLIYRGAQRSAQGVGVGSGMTAVRRAYPGASCTRAGKQRYCTRRGALAGQAVKTVFRFTATGAGRYRCDRVLIYLVDPRSGQVGA